MQQPFIILVMILLVSVIYKALINTNYWYRTNRYKNLYLKYLDEASNQQDKSTKDKVNEEIRWKFVEVTTSIIELFEKAGLKSFQLTITQPTGHNFVSHQQIDFFENLASVVKIGDIDIPRAVIKYFFTAIGVYKKRLKEAFSIIYWAQVIIFLPRMVVAYLGLSTLHSEKLKFIERVLNIIYWAIWIIMVFTHQHWILVLSLKN